MSNVVFKMDHGHVFMRTAKVKGDNGKITIITEPVFRGNSEKHATALAKAHTLSGALAVVDNLKSSDKFWAAVRQHLVRRLKQESEKKNGQ